MILVALMVSTIGTAFGQEEWEEGGEIESVEIEIVKEKQITLPRAERNFEKIPPRPADPLKPTFSYEFKSLKYQAPELSIDVRPLRVKQEELSKIYAGYISAGFGNYNSPYVEGSFTSKRDAQKFFGAELYHKSYGTGPVEGKLSASGDTRVNAFAKGMGTKLSTQAAIRYENRFNHFYAPIGTPETRQPEDVLQYFHVGGVEAGIANTKPGDVNFKLTGAFSFLADRYDASESKATLAFGSDYKLKNEGVITLSSNYKLIARKDIAAEARPRHLLSVAPSYRMTLGGKAVLDVGLNVVVENDTIGSGSFHPYPNISLAYPAGKNIETYASLRGDFEEVSLHKLSAENPWVAPNIPLFHTNKAFEVTVGAKGKLARVASFDAGAVVARLLDLYFYDNLPTDRTKFTAVYDDATRLNFFAQTGFAAGEKAQLTFRGDYYSYATDQLTYPWHRPQYKVSLYSTWMIAGKLMTDAGIVTQGGARAFDHDLNTVVELQAAIDVNLKLRYFWSKRLSLFVDGSNLLNRMYPLYLNYPSRGLQVTAGASYCF